MASKDQALDELKEAAERYISQEKTRIGNEVSFLKAVKQRLGGSDTLRASNEKRLGVLLVDEINTFLE